MQLNQPQADNIIAIYHAGGYDIEIMEYLIREGFGYESFAQWYALKSDFKSLIDQGRVLSKAFWDRELRSGNKQLPSWYYGYLPQPVLDLLALACQAAERCPIGSAEREREFKNVERLLKGINRT